MITVAVIYNGGRLRVDLRENQVVGDILAAVSRADGRYADGSLRLAWPRNSPPLDLRATISSCLQHGETVIASYATESAAPVAHDTPRQVPTRQDDALRQSSALPETGTENRMCRICHDSETTAESGRFISPCKCSGSMRFVHIECLNQWRRLSANSQSYYQCDQCLFRYSFERTRWAAWLTSDKVVLSATVLVCFLLTTVTAAVVTTLAPNLAFLVYQIGRFQPFWYFPRHWAAPYFDFYVAGAAGISTVGALMYLKREWDTWRDRPDAWYHIIRHGLWFASMSHHSLSRIGLFVGLAISYQCVFSAVKQLCLHWTTTYGEMLLDVNQ